MIDLRSDTVTRPSQAMKEAMFVAEVGDDVMGEDPTVNHLEAKLAQLFDKEAALFTTSATQANQIAIRVSTEPGDELLINAKGHIALYEAGAPAVLSGVTTKTIDTEKGKLSAADITNRIQPDDPHFVRTRLVCLENTTNIGGGYVYQLDQAKQVLAAASEAGLKSHLDGARLFNAVSFGLYTAQQFGEDFDTISICFSKGLGCPVGAALIGTKEVIHRARRVRKLLGGGTRQAGFLAAAAIFALDNNMDRLAEDHVSAKQLADGLASLGGIEVTNFPIESNMVFFKPDQSRLGSVPEFLQKLNEQGVKMGAIGSDTIRAVTHLDATGEDMVARVLSAVKSNL